MLILGFPPGSGYGMWFGIRGLVLGCSGCSVGLHCYFLKCSLQVLVRSVWGGQAVLELIVLPGYKQLLKNP